MNDLLIREGFVKAYTGGTKDTNWSNANPL